MGSEMCIRDSLEEDMPDFILEACKDVSDAIRKLKGDKARDRAAIHEAARLATRRAANRWSGKKPQVRVIMLGDDG